MTLLTLRAYRAASVAVVLCAFAVCGCSELHLHFFERTGDDAPPETEIIIKPSEPKDDEPNTEIILPSKTKPKKSATLRRRAFAAAQ